MTERPDPPDYFDDNDDCPNCGGEGYVSDCIDGCCEDAESGCDLCTRRCDWCNPPKRKPTKPAPIAPDDAQGDIPLANGDAP